MCTVEHSTFGKRYKHVPDSEFFSEDRKPVMKFNLLVYYEQVKEEIRKIMFVLGHILITALET